MPKTLCEYSWKRCVSNVLNSLSLWGLEGPTSQHLFLWKTFKNNEIIFSLMAKSFRHTIMCLQYLPPDVSHFAFNADLLSHIYTWTRQQMRQDEHQRAYRCGRVTEARQTAFGSLLNRPRQNKHSISSRYFKENRFTNRFDVDIILNSEIGEMPPNAALFDASTLEEPSFHSAQMRHSCGSHCLV